MRNQFRGGATAAAIAGLFAVALAGDHSARAADHRETPTTIADNVADIADVYTWHQGGRFVAVVTVDGIRPPAVGQTGRYDEDVVYRISIGRDNFPTTYQAAVNVVVRITRNGSGGWKVTADNVPGAGGSISGDVETVISKGSANLFVGLRDDPFFFDLEGFRNTLMTGTLMFDNTRDTFAGMNATAIVIETDLDAARNGSDKLYVWATTSRKDG